METPLRFDHFALRVADAAHARDLFGNVLGLPLLAAHSGDNWDGAPWLMMIYELPGGGQMALCALAGFAPSSFGSALVGSLFSSDAWNNVTFAAAEVRDPRRNLPLALLLGTGLVTGLYLLANLAYLSMLPLRGSAEGVLGGRGLHRSPPPPTAARLPREDMRHRALPGGRGRGSDGGQEQKPPKKRNYCLGLSDGGTGATAGVGFTTLSYVYLVGRRRRIRSPVRASIIA